MTDRSQDLPADDNDNLDYLDAGLPPDERTTPIDAERPHTARSSSISSDSGQTTPIDPISAPDREPVVERIAPTVTPVVTPPPPPDTNDPVVSGTAQRDTSWTWPIINLIGLIVVVAVNYAANYFKFNGNSTGDIVNRDPVPFQPAGWVFSIWGVIYLLLAVFVIYGLLPAGRHNPRLQRISPLFLVANLANTAWIFFWHWEQVAASLGTIIVLLLSLVGIYLGVRRHRNPFHRGPREPLPQIGWFERIALRLPFSVYLGWVCVATLANAMVWLQDSDRETGLFSLNWWAVIFMIVATLVAAVFMATAHDGVVALVIAVAFAGIAHRNWGDETAVSVAAGIFAVLALAIACIAALMAFDTRHNRPLPGSNLWRRSEPVS